MKHKGENWSSYTHYYTITVIVRQVTLLSRNQFCLYQYPVLLTQPK